MEARSPASLTLCRKIGRSGIFEYRCINSTKFYLVSGLFEITAAQRGSHVVKLGHGRDQASRRFGVFFPDVPPRRPRSTGTRCSPCSPSSGRSRAKISPSRTSAVPC